MVNDLFISTHLIYIKGFLNESLQTIRAHKINNNIEIVRELLKALINWSVSK